MTDKTIRLDTEKLKKKLEQNCACYVLITCTPPCSNGKMQVEMHFEGEEDLAAFLVHNAAQVFDADFQHRESQ